jgi:hypothetical protein
MLLRGVTCICCPGVQALGKDDKALLVNVDKMAYANLYVTDGDLHVQAVDTLPTPNPRGVFDSQRTNMIGNARAVPCVYDIVAIVPALTQGVGLTSSVTSTGCFCSYFGPPKPKPTRSTVGPGGRLPSLTGRPGSAPATAPAGTDGSAADSAGEAPSAEQERVEKMLGALCATRLRRVLLRVCWPRQYQGWLDLVLCVCARCRYSMSPDELENLEKALA